MPSDLTDRANAGWASPQHAPERLLLGRRASGPPPSSAALMHALERRPTRQPLPARSLRRLWPAALLLALSPVLAACGDDPEESSADDESSSPAVEPSSEATESPSASDTATAPSSTPPPSASAGAGTLPAPCDVVTAAELAEAYGVTFVSDGVSGGTTSQQDVEWKSKGCKFEAEDLAEVTVSLTGPDDFTKGSFQCLAPSDITGIVTPQDVTGATQAWWKTNEAPPLEAWLRACTAEAIVEINLEYEDGVDYEGDPQTQSAELAAKIVAKL